MAWQEFLKGKGGHNFHNAFKHSFFSRTNLKLIEKQERLWEVRGYATPKIFENVQALMAILVLFEQFSTKFCSNFLTLILSASPNMMYFVRTFLIMRAYGDRFKIVTD